MSSLKSWKILENLIFPIKSCSNKLYLALRNIKHKNQKTLKYIHKFLYKYYNKIAIGGIINIHHNIMLKYEKRMSICLKTQYIMEYSRCLQLWKSITYIQDIIIPGNEIYIIEELTRKYGTLYHCINRFLENTDIYLKRILENHDISNFLFNAYQRYTQYNKSILIPILYYESFETNNRKIFLRTFGIIRQLLFWIHHRTVYKYKYLKWLNIIQS
jgi:hypothetical protein